MSVELTPLETRAQDAPFVSQSSLSGLRERLPLRWSTPEGVPPSPKRRYRSHYAYLGWEDLLDPATSTHLSDFDLVLRLVDFSGLRPVLAQRLGWTSARGWCPFDPVSIFLLQGWQIVNGWSRAQTLRNLHDPRYADYGHRFGFRDAIFPTEGGMRYTLTALGRHSDAPEEMIAVESGDGQSVQVAVQHLNQLIAGATDLIRQANLLDAQAWKQALVCPDGMIHDAASRMRCASVQATCSQPTTDETPRPCPAKEKDRQGCDCSTPACARACRYSTPRDPEARFVWYDGSNRPRKNPNHPSSSAQGQKKDGKGRYGYRSLCLQLADPSRRFSLVLLEDLLSASGREENPAAALLCQLHTFYPDLHLAAVAADAAFGYASFLLTTYKLGAKRVIDLRAHDTDRDESQWVIRGYDDKGRPICAYGYHFIANGFDARRRRHKWLCDRACLKGTPPRVLLQDVTYPPTECPFQADAYPRGRIINVAERFADNSLRLVRDIPVGTPAWKRLYHRARNAAEGRNAALESWGLKRLPFYGLYRAKALTFLADTWLNLTTLARLVREATAATGA